MQYRRFLLTLTILMVTLIACEPTYPERSHAALSRAATATAGIANVTALPAAPTRATALAAVIAPTDTPTALPPTATASPQPPTHTPTTAATTEPTKTPTPAPTDPPTATQVATATATATATSSPEPTATTEATTVPTVVPSKTSIAPPTLSREDRLETAIQAPEISCKDRIPSNDLLEIVTREYAISESFEPNSLVLLSDYFGANVTLGYGTEVRAVVLEPLQAMIAEMHSYDLRPTVISGYRSYQNQYLAWRKWNAQYPDRASILSAPPGTSEHQLGTTVDFGSPELNNEFHTYFYKTSEGGWLLENAHRYGFTLSYPLEAYEVTQFYYEPWHYRYVGVEMATALFKDETTLTEYQLQTFPPPCNVEP